jgi:hypothetical protein
VLKTVVKLKFKKELPSKNLIFGKRPFLGCPLNCSTSEMAAEPNIAQKMNLMYPRNLLFALRPQNVPRHTRRIPNDLLLAENSMIKTSENVQELRILKIPCDTRYKANKPKTGNRYLIAPLTDPRAANKYESRLISSLKFPMMNKKVIREIILDKCPRVRVDNFISLGLIALG